jgi:hypothetical protein
LFGIMRPCRHHLTGDLRAAWRAHLCGLCLALRDDHGQLARVATNYDGLIVSALVEAQRPGAAGRRHAGPCPLRGMRSAEVVDGESARLAAVVSLALAAAKTSDHVADGDGLFRRRAVAALAGRLARRWAEGATRIGRAVGFDAGELLREAERQPSVEAAAGSGTTLETVTEPTATAVAMALGHTAILAGRPDNADALREVGRCFGRIAHLLDATEDLEDDRRSGAWNPILATGAGLGEARRVCEESLDRLRRALCRVDFVDGRLVYLLLGNEVGHAIHRTFGGLQPAMAMAGGPPGSYQPPAPPPPYQPPPGQPPPPPGQTPPPQPGQPGPPTQRGVDLGPYGQAGPPPPRRRRGGGDGGDCDCDCGACGDCGPCE